MKFQNRASFFFQAGTLAVSLAVSSLGCSSSSAEPKKLQSESSIVQEQAAAIHALKQEVARLNEELEQVFASRDDLAQAQSDLENELSGQMAAGDASVSMEAKGLVVTVLDRVLFDSGKAELKPGSEETLQTVAGILSNRVRENRVFVEGHTDNIPIRFSNWKSNWELSTARSLEVVHYFVSQQGVDPRRIAAVGYAEFVPIADNATFEGRQKNRRVEIVISPNKVI